MGYYTEYTLEIEGYDVQSEIRDIQEKVEQYGVGLTWENLPLVRRLREITEEKFYWSADEGCFRFDRTKWYEWEGDMKVLSKEFPDLVFVLRGQGEYNDDVWRAQFSNGEVRKWRAKVIMEEVVDGE